MRVIFLFPSASSGQALAHCFAIYPVDYFSIQWDQASFPQSPSAMLKAGSRGFAVAFR